MDTRKLLERLKKDLEKQLAGGESGLYEIEAMMQGDAPIHSLIFHCGGCGKHHLHANITAPHKLGNVCNLKCSTKEDDNGKISSGGVTVSEEIISTFAYAATGESFSEDEMAGILKSVNSSKKTVVEAIVDWIEEFGADDAKEFVRTNCSKESREDAPFFFKGIRKACKARREVQFARESGEPESEERN